MPNFSSVALFVQKLFRWGNFTPPQLFNVHKKAQLGKPTCTDFVLANSVLRFQNKRSKYVFI